MSNYYTTPLEDWIKELYQGMGIMEPYQLDMLDIASKLNIWIHLLEMDSKAIDREGLPSMLIDKRLSYAEQWQEFGHELCHLLKQSGKQPDMPESFILFQETKAENFMYEFCVPSFMLINFSFPQRPGEAIQFVADTFNVTREFAYKRLKQIERRMLSNQYYTQLVATLEAENHYKRKIGCDYVIRGRHGTALYSHHKGLIGFINHKEEF